MECEHLAFSPLKSFPEIADSVSCSSGKLWLVRATRLIKPSKKPYELEMRPFFRCKGHLNMVRGCFHLHLWTFSSPGRDMCHFIWPWDREELRFTAKVFRTSVCLAHLFASSLEPQCGKGMLQLWSYGWENKNTKFCWYSEVNRVPQILSAGWCS